ncbi:hypothetical protein D3C87_588080 [compost metagenome]
MKIGDLSKRQGVQPGSAKHKVLQILKDHEQLITKELDAKSPWDSAVFSREARAMAKTGLVKKDFQHNTLLVAFSITDLGSQILEDLDAYSEEFKARKLSNFYNTQMKKLTQFIEQDQTGNWAVGKINDIFWNERYHELTTPTAKKLTEAFNAKLSGLTIVVAEQLETHNEGKSLEPGYAKELCVYATFLGQRNINTHFSKEFLNKLMIGKLENDK